MYVNITLCFTGYSAALSVGQSLTNHIRNCSHVETQMQQQRTARLSQADMQQKTSSRSSYHQIATLPLVAPLVQRAGFVSHAQQQLWVKPSKHTLLNTV
jgi:hypothetical protein